MRSRRIDPHWPLTQATLNWAAWHRMDAWDPQWEQRVIVGNGPPEHSCDRWFRWKQSDARWRVKVIDTTSLDIEHTLNRIAAWLTSEQQKLPLLAPETKWWQGNHTREFSP